MKKNQKTPVTKQLIPILTDEYSSEELQEIIYTALMLSNSDSIYVKDLLSRFNLINQRVVTELEVSDPSEIIGKTDIDLFGENFGSKTRLEEEHLFATGNPIEGIIEARGEDNSSKFWTYTTKIPLRNSDGTIIGLVGITRNINEIKLVEQNLQVQATHDPLTNVFNRAGLLERLHEMVNISGNMVAVIEIDLDNFKQINDVYFHKTGDEFLKWFAWLLKSTLRGNDVVSRVGGDEFVLILDKIKKAEDAAAFCRKLYRNYNQTVEERFKKLGVGMSIGISIFPGTLQNAHELMDQADQALYYVKNNGKGFYRYFGDES